MTLWQKLFSFRHKMQQATISPVLGGPIEDAPQSKSDEEIIEYVLESIHMAILGSGRGAMQPNIGPTCQDEFEVIQQFRKSRGYSYRDVETIFWSPEFRRIYLWMLSLARKRKILDNLNHQEFLKYHESGKAKRTQEDGGDGIVHYLTCMGFDMAGLR